MTIKQHTLIFFLVPVAGILLVVAFLPLIANLFPSFVLFYPIVAMTIVVLISFATQFLHVSCPECHHKLIFENEELANQPRYQCEKCHFEKRGFFK